MALNRDKYRKIVGGITSAEPEETPVEEAPLPTTFEPVTSKIRPAAGQGGNPGGSDESNDHADSRDSRRFAKRGRPKGPKPDETAAKGRKVKVSLFLSEVLVNDLYEWAHTDKIHPGEMFERALKPFHDKEMKRRNTGKE
jgi:hypothetical protein